MKATPPLHTNEEQAAIGRGLGQGFPAGQEIAVMVRRKISGGVRQETVQALAGNGDEANKLNAGSAGVGWVEGVSEMVCASGWWLVLWYAGCGSDEPARSELARTL
jgi:hypothetical protein